MSALGRELTMPDTCAWCGESLKETAHDADNIKFVIEGEPHRDAHVEAAFHGGTCYGEAKSYGWE